MKPRTGPCSDLAAVCTVPPMRFRTWLAGQIEYARLRNELVNESPHCLGPFSSSGNCHGA